jgi:hypothetical protein
MSGTVTQHRSVPLDLAQTERADEPRFLKGLLREGEDTDMASDNFARMLDARRSSRTGAAAPAAQSEAEKAKGGLAKTSSSSASPAASNAAVADSGKSATATDVQKLIDEARSLESKGEAAAAAKKREEAIEAAVKAFKIDTRKTKSLVYDKTVKGEAAAKADGSVRVGDDAFRNAAWLGSSIGHEVETHVNGQAMEGKWYTGPQGTAIQEVQAYDYEIANKKRYGTSNEDVKDLEKRRQAYYESLSEENRKKVDGRPPDYTLKNSKD